MAPPHTTRINVAGRSRPAISKDSSKKSLQKSAKPVSRPTRLNKVPLAGASAATSRALSLQAKDIRVKKKRSRPQAKGKSLNKLGNLLDALPSMTEEHSIEKNHKKKKLFPTVKSLKPRPGMQKRRAVLEKKERERFGLNMAILASAGGVKDATRDESMDATLTNTQNATKWAALRKHIVENLVET